MDYSKTQFQKIFGNKKLNFITCFENLKGMPYLKRHLDFYQNFFMNAFLVEKVVAIVVTQSISYYVFSSTKNVIGDNYLVVIDYENELFVVTMSQSKFHEKKNDMIAFVAEIKDFLLASAQELVVSETSAA